MFVTIYSLFAFIVISKQVQTISSQKANDSTRLDFEYRLLERLQRMERNVQGHGSTYVRWGRNTCPEYSTDLVYKGFAGGSFWTHSGGAADFLCLPENPTWGANVGNTDASGFIYGAEYRVSSGTNPFWTVSSELDVPCSVCRTTRANILMIPARTNCYPGWSMEYTGYLMSGRYSHSGATNYVCVDAHPESRAGSIANQEGHLMYIVQAKCGSLPCPPYVENRVIACVLCSM